MRSSGSRRLLLPLVPLYAGAVAVKSWAFDRGLLAQKHLKSPVISVGSLSAGGAGKTPVVLMLAELLHRRGFDVRILTRGYGRSGKGVEQVDPAGDATRFGDEPLLIARRLDTASVYVGADRYQAGLLAERSAPIAAQTIHLLDDGFQHSKLARNIDIVLLTRRDVEDRLLPAGDLREPLSALQRADAIVVREDEAEMADMAAERTRGKSIWIIRRTLQFPVGLLAPSRPVVFCGLARPESFTGMLASSGISPAATVIFRDHHSYRPEDIANLLSVARQNQANSFLITEKDAVKLTPETIKRLTSVGPVIVPQLHVELVDEQASLEQLLSMIAATR